MSTTQAPRDSVRIQNYEALTGSTIRGKFALILGFALLNLAGLMCLAAWGGLPSDVAPPNVPPLAFTWIALAFFGLPGIFLMLLGGRDLASDLRVAKEKPLRPNDPWRWDHAWDAAETSDTNLSRVLWTIGGCVIAVSIIAPFNYFAWSEDLPWFALAGIGLFDLFGLLGVGTAAYRLLAELRHGRSRLRYAAFPLRLGAQARLTLLPAGRLDDVRRLRCTLRCVEERYEARTSGSHAETVGAARTVSVAGYERHRDEQTLDAFAAQSGAWGIELAFDLPDDPELRTRLSERPPQYWELVVDGERPGVDYHKRFLLPVY
jgi:hypothetical protein